MTEDAFLFFHHREGALPLYEKLEEAILSRIPDVHIRVQKTQITFANRHVFACASFLPVRRAKERPSPFLTVTFGLSYRRESSRIDAAVEAAPRRWTHHVMVGNPAEIDDELLAWVEEAAAFSAAK